ncbi:hypothetical protein NDU88_005318 [Pleurodeles waltl]|uniref:PH domain-containing protein n=1 Tax=Pleurodeles waltl TaxID=8319 RepID=A0AAV7QGW0_PLEWA|nr:hypothetical protein NDU88_005318 [Pleurodeles waltl]
MQCSPLLKGGLRPLSLVDWSWEWGGERRAARLVPHPPRSGSSPGVVGAVSGGAKEAPVPRASRSQEEGERQRGTDALTVFNGLTDVKAHTSIPLLGYMVKDVSADDSRHLFQLAQSGQLYTFQAESEEQKQSWLSVLTLAVTGDIFMAGDDDSPGETD